MTQQQDSQRPVIAVLLDWNLGDTARHDLFAAERLLGQVEPLLREEWEAEQMAALEKLRESWKGAEENDHGQAMYKAGALDAIRGMGGSRAPHRSAKERGND